MTNGKIKDGSEVYLKRRISEKTKVVEHKHNAFAYLRELNLTRRAFLKLSGLSVAGVITGVQSPDIKSAFAQLVPTFRVSVLRPMDLLALDFVFFNLHLKTDQPLGARLERIDKSQSAYIVVRFPSQNIGEEAFLEAEPRVVAHSDIDPFGNDPSADEQLMVPGTVAALIAGGSRLAFKVGTDIDFIPYTLESLLGWVRFEPSVAPVALPPSTQRGILCSPPRRNKPTMRAPEAWETAIEIPWKLLLSTHRCAAWAHCSEPVDQGTDFVELWHTRLSVRQEIEQESGQKKFVVKEQDEELRTLRAIWTPEFGASFDKNTTSVPAQTELGPFRMSLGPKDRYQIVRLTSDFSEGYTPSPIKVDRLMLTPLGAWMNLRGSWDIERINNDADLNPEGFKFTLTEWRHRATMGRDHYARLVYLGYLFPFGHPAALIKITERKFQRVPSGPLMGNAAAYLRQRFYIVVRNPVMTYPAPYQPNDGRQMPFRTVRITTLITPNLDDPNDKQYAIGNKGQDAFWPRVGSKDFAFHLVGEDADGQQTEFTAPLAFISTAFSGDAFFLSNTAFKDYGASESRQKRSLGGQKIAFAPSTPSKPGDTTLIANSLTFDATLPDPVDAIVPPDRPRFYPIIKSAEVRLMAAEQMSGKSLLTTIELQQKYIDFGFDPRENAGAVFAKLVNDLPLEFPADKSGGIVTPNMNIQGLSRILGPVGDIDKLVTGSFEPASFFKDAKILGGIDLADIIAPVSINPSLSAINEKVPKTISRIIYTDDDPIKLPRAIETQMTWAPEVNSSPGSTFQKMADTSLLVDATILTELKEPDKSRFTIVGELKNFRINLINDDSLKFISIDFNRLKFTSEKDKKPDIDVSIKNVEFSGALALVNELQAFLKSSGKGPSIDISPVGITASYTLAVPSIAVGVFTLQNISLTAGLNIPLSGDPARVRFQFAKREKPFLLTVAMFGGGGFFGIALGLDGIEILEASFEFGAQIALDIGVASGAVYVMGGVYFKMEKDTAQLTGYLRMGGSVEVLGLITVSAEFYMGLSYDFQSDEIWGQCTLTVEIELAFFSTSVDLHVERRFAGSTHSITFEDLVNTQEQWDDYVDAFAPV